MTLRRSWNITILQHEQVDDQAWPELARFVRRWNAYETPQFESVSDFMFQITFDEDARPKLDLVLERLRGLQRAMGAEYHLSAGDTYEDEDYAKADFIELLGTDVEMTPPLVVNEDEVFAATPPCPRCGWQDLFDAARTVPLVIDETRLRAKVADGPAPPPDGWDAVNLPNGDKVVSARLVAVLDNNGVEGYELQEVIDAATGGVSPRVFHVAAKRAVLTPCPSHTVVGGEGFCPECGTALGNLEGYLHVRADHVGNDEVISRHPRRGAMLYVSRRVQGLLEAASLSGLHREGLLMVCRH